MFSKKQAGQECVTNTWERSTSSNTQAAQGAQPLSLASLSQPSERVGEVANRASSALVWETTTPADPTTRPRTLSLTLTGTESATPAMQYHQLLFSTHSPSSFCSCCSTGSPRSELAITAVWGATSSPAEGAAHVRGQSSGLQTRTATFRHCCLQRVLGRAGATVAAGGGRMRSGPGCQSQAIPSGPDSSRDGLT